MDKPLYKHDCELCVFLGQFENEDLYFCGNQIGPTSKTVIARCSDAAGDYVSGLCFTNVIPALKEAEIRAVKKGLLGM
jgi:hypothetical protein